MKIRLVKKIMKHKCTFLNIEEKYKKKGYNVKWLLAWGAYDERKTCRNALPIDHRITKAISLTKKKVAYGKESIDTHRQQAMV